MPEAADEQTRVRELAALCSHLQGEVEHEKSSLAHRLHDELGGLLTAAKMDLSWVQSHLESPQLQPRLAQLGNVLDEAMNLKRRVVDELRPSLLDHFGLPTALRTHVESTCAKAGIDCEVSLLEEMEEIPKSMAIALFRVIQQGLDNIVRHSGARSVKIKLDAEEDHFVLQLSDDGRGISLSGPGHPTHGLTGMRHRIETLQGVFKLTSSSESGTVLDIRVPKIS